MFWSYMAHNDLCRKFHFLGDDLCRELCTNRRRRRFVPVGGIFDRQNRHKSSPVTICAAATICAVTHVQNTLFIYHRVMLKQKEMSDRGTEYQAQCIVVSLFQDKRYIFTLPLVPYIKSEKTIRKI